MLHCRLFEKFTFFCSLEHMFSSAYLSHTCRRLLANTDSIYSVRQRALSGGLPAVHQILTGTGILWPGQHILCHDLFLTEPRTTSSSLFTLCSSNTLNPQLKTKEAGILTVTEPAGISSTEVRFMHHSSILFTNARWKPRKKDSWTSQNVQARIPRALSIGEVL